MQVRGACKHCDHKIPYKGRILSKSQFFLLTGGALDLTCPKCGHENQFQVDELEARESPILVFTTILSLLIVVFCALAMAVRIYFGLSPHWELLLSIVPAVIFTFIRRSSIEKIDLFNIEKVNS